MKINIQLFLDIGKKLPKPIKKPLSWIYNKLFIKIDKEMIRDLKEYFNLSQKEIISLLKLGDKLSAIFWSNLNPRTEEEIKEFYKTTPFYVFSLVFWHARRDERLLRSEIIQLSKGNILDYGAGVGDLCIKLVENRSNVDYADVCGRTFDFAKWLFQKRDCNVKMIDLSKSKLSKNYDMIICLDVIEHVVNPKELLTDLVGHLEDNGKLIITNLHSVVSEVHPMHIEIKFDPEKYLSSLGLIKIKESWLWTKPPKNEIKKNKNLCYRDKS